MSTHILSTFSFFAVVYPLPVSDSSYSSILCLTNVLLVFQVVVRVRFSCLSLLSSTFQLHSDFRVTPFRSYLLSTLAIPLPPLFSLLRPFYPAHASTTYTIIGISVDLTGMV